MYIWIEFITNLSRNTFLIQIVDMKKVALNIYTVDKLTRQKMFGLVYI